MTTSITVTITDLLAIDGWVSLANQGRTPLETLIQETLMAQGHQLAEANGIGRFPSSDFLLRFTDAEFAAIRAAEATDANIAAILVDVRKSPSVVINDPRLTAGLAYLVAAGLLSAERAAEVVAYPRPELLDPNAPPVEFGPGPGGPGGPQGGF